MRTNALTITARNLALAIWSEQIAAGIGAPGESADISLLGEWLSNRTYPLAVLESAADGSTAALATVRSEAGLPILS